VFFVVFFYGLQTIEDALAVANAFLVGVVVANVITVLDASGVLGLNIIAVRTADAEEYGRVQGAFGEANQHAAVIAMVLPAMCAKVLLSRGFWRLPWIAGVGFGIAVLFMTASRGAMLGLVLGALWGAVVFRRYVSLGSVAVWIGGAVVMIGVVLLAVSDNYVELVKERVVGLSLSGNVTEASSGRNAIWGEILQRMMGSPWSFITGFGWNAYSVMDFEYAAHNTYLGMWFNLGLPGVLAFCAVLFQAIAAGRRAADVAPADLRPMFIACSIGFLALCVSIFFVELFIPWLYVWAYLGLMMRASVAVTSAAAGAGETEARPGLSAPAPVRLSRRRSAAAANGRPSPANR
jgi:O-antigen ligase